MQGKLDERLKYIQSLILKMGSLVEQSIALSSKIFLKNLLLLKDLRVGEKKINALQLKISRESFKILALKAPVARDLRYIISVVQANTDLERMGDLSLNIAKRTQQIFKKDPLLREPLKLFSKMFDRVRRMAKQVLEAFLEENEKQARGVLKEDREVNQIRDSIKKKLELIVSQNSYLIKPGIDLILIVGEIERIADHITNIAEEIIFFKTGDDIRHLSSLGPIKKRTK